MRTTLKAVLDREEIRQVRADVAWALDTRDWDLFTSLFTDEVDADLSALGAPHGPMPRETLVSLFQQAFARPADVMATQQLYGSVAVDLDEDLDSATVRSYLLGHHVVPGFEGGDDVTLRCAYTDRMTRTAEGWKISATSLRVFSVVGNAAIFA